VAKAWAFVEDGVVTDAHDADQLVPWWSFTKTILATAILRLVRDGALDLDKPAAGRLYTLRHLLQHRSGLPDYGWLPAYHAAVARGDVPWTVPDLLARVDAHRLRYPPGEGWEYSNIGYLFVRQVIEEVTNESLGAALRRLVLHPLSIGSARVATEPHELVDVRMGSASSYHPAWVYHGLMVGSVQDAALLLHRLTSGSLLADEALRMMLERFMLPGPIAGRPWKSPGYGLGIMSGETTRGIKVAGHTGGGPGSSIAVYSRMGEERAHRTSAFFALSEEHSDPEEGAFALLA